MNKLEQMRQQMEKKKQQIKLQSQNAPEGQGQVTALELLSLPQNSIDQNFLPPSSQLIEPQHEINDSEDKKYSPEPGEIVPRNITQSEDHRLTPQREKPQRLYSENISVAAHKASVDEANQKPVQHSKLQRYLLKDVDKLKEAMSNIEGCLRGVDYIRKKIKLDRSFRMKVKNKLRELRHRE